MMVAKRWSHRGEAPDRTRTRATRAFHLLPQDYSFVTPETIRMHFGSYAGAVDRVALMAAKLQLPNMALVPQSALLS
jgi:hypothetical protein